ncbi:guanylate kinase [Spirochaetota bacterium]
MNIVISAPSGTGKTSLIKRLLQGHNIYEFSISVTTRPIREGENDGVNYYFVPVEDFKAFIDKNEFIEWAIVHGNYYGTTKKEIDRIRRAGNIPIFDVDIQGAVHLKDQLEDSVYIFIVPPSMDELKKRLISRKTESEDQIKLRLENAGEELKKYHLFDYIVVNDEIEAAEKKLRAIISAELCKRDRMKSSLNKLMEN